MKNKINLIASCQNWQVGDKMQLEGGEVDKFNFENLGYGFKKIIFALYDIMKGLWKKIE